MSNVENIHFRLNGPFARLPSDIRVHPAARDLPGPGRIASFSRHTVLSHFASFPTRLSIAIVETFVLPERRQNYKMVRGLHRSQLLPGGRMPPAALDKGDTAWV